MPIEQILAVGLALLALFYVGAPILVRFTQSHAARPQFEPVALEHLQGLPPGMKISLYRAAEELEGLGFERLGTARQTNQPSGMLTVLTMLQHPVSKDWGGVIGLVAGPDDRRVEARQVEFSTPYLDGTSVNTNNSSELPVFENTRKTVLQFPSIQDVARLHRLHTAATSRYGSGAARREIWKGHELAAVAEVMRADLEEWVERGLFFLDETGEHFKPTWKGAFIATWRLLPPLKWFLQFQRRLQVRRQLRELES